MAANLPPTRYRITWTINPVGKHQKKDLTVT